MSSNIKLNYFKLAVDSLKQVMRENKTDIVRDSAIKRYELCYELSWKTIQELLKSEGMEVCKSPRSCFKEAFGQGWIEDEEGFADMVEKRNLTTHTYDKKLAEAVYQKINDYLALFESLLEKITMQQP